MRQTGGPRAASKGPTAPPLPARKWSAHQQPARSRACAPVRAVSLGTAECRRITEGGGLPASPGVYAVYDEQMNLQYVGMSRHVASSCAGHADALPGVAVYAKARAVASGSKAELQAAWKQWIQEHGALPPGNAPGEVKWTSKAPAARPAIAAVAKASAVPPAPLPSIAELRSKVVAYQHPTVAAHVTPAVMQQLEQRGFAVIDGFLQPELVQQARTGAEFLRSQGLLRQVTAQKHQGRDDENVVLNEKAGTLVLPILSTAGGPKLQAAVEQVSASPECAALASLVHLLKGVPYALMDQQQQLQNQRQQQQQQRLESQGALPPSVSGAAWLPELSVPESFMLALYPGEGAHYRRHLDNDMANPSPASTMGPHGQRICDRAVTAILYLNDSWRTEDGGCLRLLPLDARSEDDAMDVAPESGRLVVFQSRTVEHEVMDTFRPRWALSAWIPAMAAYSPQC